MAEKKEDTERYNIKVAGRCFSILDLAASKGAPISLQDVCTALDVNVNMAFRLLSSIQAAGYLDKNPATGLYSLSLRCLSLSSAALQTLDIRKIAIPYLELLWSQYPKANVNLGLRSGMDIMTIDRIDSECLPRTYFSPGRRLPFHCSALGKVLTSELEEAEIDRMIAASGGLKPFTPNTITDRKKLLEELARVRAEGCGRDRNEYIHGDNCSAVPVRDRDGQIAAAISISALDVNMSEAEVEATIPALKKTAARISEVLGL